MSEEIETLILERRVALSEDPDFCGPPDIRSSRWGLALSGGGIRSSTFCFGLLHAFARQQKLLRFDLLSTVSGGGYIGSMLGRLVQRATNPAQVREVEAALAQANTTWFAWWLRANGRYLIPHGVKDTFQALAIYLRNLIGIHTELALAGVMIGCLLALFNWVFWPLQPATLSPAVLSFSREWVNWIPTLWLLELLVVPSALVAILAYWSVPLVSQRKAMPLLVCLSVILFGSAIFAFNLRFSHVAGGSTTRQVLCTLGVSISFAWILALLIARSRHHRSVLRCKTLLKSNEAAEVEAQDVVRNEVTNVLAWILRTGIAILILGIVDRFAWWIAFDVKNWSGAALWLIGSAALLRALLPASSALRPGTMGAKTLLLLASVLGRLLTFFLLAWWIAIVHKAVLGAMFSIEAPDFTLARLPFIVMACGAVGYAVATGWNIGFLNNSSLHGFYRARLVRSYLGASNPERFGYGSDKALGAIDKLPPDPEDALIKDVGDVDPNDDLPICQYAPHRYGGPVHLLNSCLNETTDPRGGLLNRDRRGRSLTIGPNGLIRVGQQNWKRLRSDAASLTLGSWMAISGAAVSSGLGAMTRGGLSALTMFAGARLGYWWDSSAVVGREAIPRHFVPKLGGLLRETLGVFGGTKPRDWYLTDGGHFENTGAYPLLVEKASLIVVADCGADPLYRFGDLENLVRKARIDLGAEIRFLRPVKPSTDAKATASLTDDTKSLYGTFGSLNDLASDVGFACFALARIEYREPNAAGPSFLVLVKPNLCTGLPVDLFNFKAEHPQFPQQGTADQQFDEAQWESYFQLGAVLGSLLNLDRLSELLRQEKALFQFDDGSPLPSTGPKVDDSVGNEGVAEGESKAKDGSKKDGSKDAATPSRIPARIARDAVTATLSLGAVATAGVASWQAIDAARNGLTQQAKDERAALKELTELWANLQSADQGKSKASLDALASALGRVSDTLCPSDEAEWFTRSELAKRILSSALAGCEKQTPKSDACAWLLDTSKAETSGPNLSCLAKTFENEENSSFCTPYWAYDYRSRANPTCAPPKDPSRDARLIRYQQKQVELGVVAAKAPSDSTPLNPAASSPGTCNGATVAPRIYGPLSSQPMKDSFPAWISSWEATGAKIGDTIDLIAKAKFEGAAAPPLRQGVTLTYAEGVSRECAMELAEVASRNEAWLVEPAGKSAQLPPGVVEIVFGVSSATSIPPASGATSVPEGAFAPGATSSMPSVEPGPDAIAEPPFAKSTSTLPLWRYQRIGLYGFGSGSAELPAASECLCAVARNLTDPRSTTYVVGSHDGVKMTTASLEKFSSNEALALSRANAVVDALKVCHPAIAGRTFAVASLPAEVGPSPGAERLARERRVDIYAELKSVPPQCKAVASGR